MKDVRNDVVACIFAFISLLPVFTRSSLTEVTSETFGNNLNGVIAAFGDFNADKSADIFIITNGGKSLQVLLTSIEDEPFKAITLLRNKSDSGIISNVVPADFDGDTRMDILVTRKVNMPDLPYSVQVQIYWGVLTENSLEPEPLTLPDYLDDQPLLLDANGDLIPDLLGEKNGQAFYWIFREGSRDNLTVLPVESSKVKLNLTKPQSSAFVDMDGDLAADLSLVSENGLQQWNNVYGEFRKGNVSPYHPDMKIRGQATYVDADGDSNVDVLMPSCNGDVCDIWVLSKLEWHKLGINFDSGGGTKWRFVTPDQNPPGLDHVPVTLRAGDFNLDGYPDLLAILQHTPSEGEVLQRAYLLQNVGCGGSQCGGFTRTYTVAWSTTLSNTAERAVLATFFDFHDNGILDIVMTTYISSNKEFRTHLLKHTFEQDACFMKVMVTSGVCLDNCPAHRKPYGINQPGPVVKFSTMDTNGDAQVGAATQLTQSAYFALQQPFVLFGLGQTPNFVDKLYVGIPHPNGTDVRTKSWSSVIPNSQLVIIPYPHDDPSSWTNKLFVTPSKLVLLTGAALLGTCGFLAGLVGILHWREKVEDKKEKLQDAHKFHFDAM